MEKLSGSLCNAPSTRNCWIAWEGCPTAARVATQSSYRKEETASGWLSVLDDAGIPSAVIETLYVNNRVHAAYLLTDAGGKKVAQTVAHGIINWLATRGKR